MPEPIATIDPAPEAHLEPAANPPADPPANGEDALGDAGKKALDAMKAERNAAKAEKAAIAAELKALKDAAELATKGPDEQALERAKQEARAEVTEAANKRLIAAEVKAAAAGKLANPELAQKLIDTSSITVDAEGNIDASAVADAVTALLTQYPSLAAQGGAVQFDSSRGKPAPVGQLTQSDLKGMSPEAIVKAESEGRLDRLKGKI
jgi:membrane protein involved in colicin uptake